MARSKYDFTLNCEVEQAKQVVQKYMDANGFKPITKKGETYYKAGDAMVDAGFNLVSLATNHTMDSREKAVLNSRKYWDRQQNILAVRKL